MTILLNPTLARGLTGQAHFDSSFKLREAMASKEIRSNKGMTSFLKALERKFHSCVPRDHIIATFKQGKGKDRFFLGIFLASTGDDARGFPMGYTFNERFRVEVGGLPIQITDHFIQRAFERLATTEIKDVAALLLPVYQWFLDRGHVYEAEEHAVDVDGRLDIPGLGSVRMNWVAKEQQYVLKTFLHESQLKH